MDACWCWYFWWFHVSDDIQWYECLNFLDDLNSLSLCSRQLMKLHNDFTDIFFNKNLFIYFFIFFMHSLQVVLLQFYLFYLYFFLLCMHKQLYFYVLLLVSPFV